MDTPVKNIIQPNPVKRWQTPGPLRHKGRLLGIIAACIFGAMSAFAQDTISLSQCYDLLDQNYPLVKQKQLLARSADFSRTALQKNFLPQVNLNAQATYQSDVPHVPVSPPGTDIPLPNKDQYRATVDVNQLLFDGGTVKHSIGVEDLNKIGRAHV